MAKHPQPTVSQPNDGFFERAFFKALWARFPFWEAAIAASTRSHRPIEIEPANGEGRPLVIEMRFGDTVTLFPCCNFGLDYTFTAGKKDLEESPLIVLEKVLSDIADFINDRTVVAIKRYKWLFIKLGWDVRFLPTHEADAARHAGASIVAWSGSVG